MRRAAGITLIELLVSLSIIGILLTGSLVNYQRHVQRMQRLEATTALLRLATAQERHLLQYRHFAGSITEAPPAGLALESSSPRGLYQLALHSSGGLPGWELSATVVADSAQRRDTQCWQFTLNHHGQRSALTIDGLPATEDCWR